MDARGWLIEVKRPPTASSPATTLMGYFGANHAG
jgi:hypothetical protein